MFGHDKGNITMSRGDTGMLTYRFSRKDGEPFVEGEDKAIYTVKNMAGTVIKEKIYDLGATNGIVQLMYHNADTDTLPLGVYQYDIRVVLGAIMQGGRVIDGNNVITHKDANQKTITLIATVGEV